MNSKITSDHLRRGADVIARIGTHPINRLAELLPYAASGIMPRRCSRLHTDVERQRGMSA